MLVDPLRLALIAGFMVGTLSPPMTAGAADAPPMPAPLFTGSKGELWATHRYETGVSNRLLVDSFAKVAVTQNTQILAGLGGSFIQQNGLALMGLGVQYALPGLFSDVTFSLQHERWTTWRSSENRALAFWNFSPFESLNIAVGAAYRAPQYDGLGLAQVVSWPRGSSEVSAVYRLHWRFLHYRDVGAALMVWNYDRMRLYTSDNIHFTAHVTVDLLPQWTLQAMLGTAASGVSGAVVSWPQRTISLGVAYEVM